MDVSPVKFEELSFTIDSGKCEGRFSTSRAENVSKVDDPRDPQPGSTAMS